MNNYGDTQGFNIHGEWAGDTPIRLDQLLKLIPKLQRKYGARAELRFDAGYNNVSVTIVPSKRLKEKKK